mgnify:CR=1 FL=1
MATTAPAAQSVDAAVALDPTSELKGGKINKK